jgi:hypothetical protein
MKIEEYYLTLTNLRTEIHNRFEVALKSRTSIPLEDLDKWVNLVENIRNEFKEIEKQIREIRDIHFSRK